MSDYNPEFNEPEHYEPEPKISKLKCAAKGCKLMGTQNGSTMCTTGESDFYCRYHFKFRSTHHPTITQILHQCERLFRIIRVTNAIGIEQFDEFKADPGRMLIADSLKPGPDENFVDWKHRVRYEIHDVIMGRVEKSVEHAEIQMSMYSGAESRNVTAAVATLMNGSLLSGKKNPAKPNIGEEAA